MGKIILNNIEYGIGISNGVNVDTTNLVEKDSIVTTLDDTVTDEQIPSAKAVHTAIQNVSGGVTADVYSKTEVDDLLADKADSTDIIDSYTKEEVDNLLNAKVDTDDVVDAYSKEEVNNLLANKADSDTIVESYSKDEMDILLADKANTSAIIDAYTKDETNDLLDAKVNVADLVDSYSKDEINGLLADKVNVDDLVDAYSKTEVDGLLADKANIDDIVDAYTKTEVDTLLNGKADTTALDGKLDKTAIVTSVSSTSTDEEIPSAKSVHTAIQEAKTELESEIANIPKVTKTSELTNNSGFITLSDIPDVDLSAYALKTQIPTTLPASDVYAWAKASTKPTYTASEVGALASNGTATNASKVSNNLTLQIAGTTKNTFNGSSAQTFNIPNASTSTPGVMTTAQVTKLDGIATGATKNTVTNNLTSTSTTDALSAYQGKVLNEAIDNLKNTVVDGKTSVANAINGKLGTTLSNQTSFADMAYYIGTIPKLSIENLYIAGYHAPTPSGVGIKYVIFDAKAKSPASSYDSGYNTAEFTNNAQNAYKRIIITCNYDGTRNVTTLNKKTITKTGTATANLSFTEADSNVSSRITIAVFDNPIYDVKALTGEYFICIP